MSKFYRMKISLVDHTFAVNAEHIRAILDLGNGHYHIWLTNRLDVPASLSKRIAKLSAVSPITQDSWEVESKELAELF